MSEVRVLPPPPLNQDFRGRLLYASYSRVYARTWLTDKELEDQEFGALTVRVPEYWDHFLADELPRIVRLVCDGLPPTTGSTGGQQLDEQTRRII